MHLLPKENGIDAYDYNGNSDVYNVPAHCLGLIAS